MTGPRTGLRTALVPVRDVDAALRERWAALEESAVEANPFFGPDLLEAAARRLPGGADVRLLLVLRGDDPVLVLPVLRDRHRRVPLPAVTTWRHAYRYVGTPLAREDALAPAAGAALTALSRLGAWAALEQLYLDGPVATALRAAAAERGAGWTEDEVWERPAVHARDEDSYLSETLSARSAKGLRRHRRGLERELGPVAAVDGARGAPPAAVAEQVDAFLALEAAGWKGAAGTAMRTDPGAAAFLHEAAAGLARAGRLELWRLEAGTTAVARQVHLVAGRTVFHLKTTYDERWARCSPGLQLELDVLRAFHEDPRLDLLDPCTDDLPGPSARLYPDRRRLGTALVGLHLPGRAAARLVPHARTAWRSARQRVAPTTSLETP